MKEPIRVLQVFGGLDRGGSETAIMNIYRNINKKLIQFDFIVHTNKKSDYEDEINCLGGKIYRFPKLTKTNYFEYKKKWKNFFLHHPEYKIIHGHYYTISSIYFSEAKKFDLICIAHSHNANISGKKGRLIKFINYPLRFKADILLACSYNAGKWLYGEKAIKKNNFHVLKNAINIEDFTYNQNIRNKIRDELDIKDKFVIGHVGRFELQKNHFFLIDVFKEVYKKNKNAVLLLIGTGNLKTSIEEKVNELGLKDCVIFAGIRTDVTEIMQGIDLFLFPSLYEGLGIVVVEAQAASLPCIISDTVPKEAILTDLVKYLSLKSTKEYWADEIIKYSTFNRRDTSLEIKLGGYDIFETTKWIEKFYLEQNVNQEKKYQYR
ncbi:glycosyltransferase family 1 protein [Carnobacterium sp. CS13]|uniref:glycosyltransferase family 1 protein n=1 Tax=Carnobacterium sp. CS13 TaxID=2800128 RepID=UPI00191424D2|nr:glycosyltransferase family 1 protein [Carnobacterium sp. CS13]QQP69553.1 glycosyltransferase family 1 protein [Carnobacterium sp. CS13]